MTHMPPSAHQSPEMASHPSPPTPEGLMKPTLREAVDQSTGLPHPPLEGPLIPVSRHSFSVLPYPSFLLETQVNEKGEKSTEHMLFSSKYGNINPLFYNTSLPCVPLPSKPPSMHEPHLLLDA